MAINPCALCLEKQRQIDDLKEKVKGIQRALRRGERREEEGFFGSSTPSSKKPFKRNADKQEGNPKGACRGHQGNGRKSHRGHDVDQVREVAPD